MGSPLSLKSSGSGSRGGEMDILLKRGKLQSFELKEVPL